MNDKNVEKGLSLFIKKAIRGTYSWTYKNKDGSITGIEADSDVPSRYMVHYEAWNVQADTEVEVDFDSQPIDYHIKIWDEDTHTQKATMLSI
jgi:hypothetical protein